MKNFIDIAYILSVKKLINTKHEKSMPEVSRPS